MKANVPKMGELVLLYGIGEDSERGSSIRRILLELKIPAKTVTPSMLSQTVGYCAEIPGFSLKEDTEKAESRFAGLEHEEAMVLRGLTRKRLDELLSAMQREYLQVSLKAVVTAHNMGWEFHALLEELKKERDAIRSAVQARNQPEDTNK